ncbi:MAG: glycerophosphodiester phosphodiesterase family protein [Kiritimatiellae bacterium]|nr:glycerophosphodiester phosphodiesterase family protein [Kiritimatiellia bacterium]
MRRQPQSLLAAAGGFLFLCTCAAGGPLIIAHRGESLFAPENTCAAFTMAAGVANMVEIDAQVSLDGELVAMHDSTVNRTTDGSGFVSALTLAQLKALDAGSWYSGLFAGERIPTLVEAIECILPSALPFIERKTGTAQAYVDVIQALNVSSNVMILSSDWDFLAEVGSLDSAIALAAVGSGALTTNAMTNLQARGVSTLNWLASGVTTAEVALAHEYGMNIFVWTVNGAAIQDYMDMGVDGITTDDPSLFRNLSDEIPSTNEGLAEGLVSYFKMDDGLTNLTSFIAADVEFSNPGYLEGFGPQPSWTMGAASKIGGALYLDGTNDVVVIPQSESLDIGTNELTLSLWVNLSVPPSGAADGYGSIYDSYEDSYVLYLDSANRELRFKVLCGNGHTARPGIPEAALETGRWHHVAAVFNGVAGPVAGQAAIFLDGRLMDIHTGTDGVTGKGLVDIVKAGQHAAIGRNGTNTTHWLSQTVDDIAIWRRALSFAEVLQIYHAGLAEAPLQKSVMSMQIADIETFHNPAGTSMELHVDHALLTSNDIVLQSSGSITGPYSNETAATVQETGAGAFMISRPGPAASPRFYRVLNP